MIRLINRNIVRGIASYDVFFGDTPTGCSVIVPEKFAPAEGTYRLKICENRIVMMYPNKAGRCGEICAGNGLHGVIGCVMHCGELVAGVLCVRGREWLEAMKAEARVSGKEMRVEKPPRTAPQPPKGEFGLID